MRIQRFSSSTPSVILEILSSSCECLALCAKSRGLTHTVLVPTVEVNKQCSQRIACYLLCSVTYSASSSDTTALYFVWANKQMSENWRTTESNVNFFY